MSRVLTAAAFAVLLAGAAAVPAVAHHSAAAYQNSTIALKGARVTRFVWANPHSLLTVEVADAAGQVASWTAEGGSPSAMPRVGWNRNSVKPGDMITLVLYPARNGSTVGRLSRVIFADGRELLDSQEGPDRLPEHRPGETPSATTP
jgi:hypothetical protein